MAPQDPYRSWTWLGVIAVALFAAVQSYIHVKDLALEYGQPPVAAYLLPLSIDGLVAVSSLVLLRSARASVSSPWLARTSLIFAVAVTVAANAASGAANGWQGAVLAGIPAVAFVLSAELAIAMSRTRKPRSQREQTEATPAVAPSVAPVARQPVNGDRAKARAKARQLLIANPGMPLADVAGQSGTSTRTVSRIKNELPVHLHVAAGNGAVR